MLGMECDCLLVFFDKGLDMRSASKQLLRLAVPINRLVKHCCLQMYIRLAFAGAGTMHQALIIMLDTLAGCSTANAQSVRGGYSTLWKTGYLQIPYNIFARCLCHRCCAHTTRRMRQHHAAHSAGSTGGHWWLHIISWVKLYDEIELLSCSNSTALDGRLLAVVAHPPLTQ
jgi:hypothetical protein